MKGFTLIELLVVVVIIGILAGFAFPQYTRAIEKARATEAVVVAKALQDAMQRHMQEFPNEEPTNKSQISDVKLSNGSWIGNSGTESCFVTAHFAYDISGSGSISITRAENPEGCNNISDEKYSVTLSKIQGEEAPIFTSAQNEDYDYISNLFNQ